MSKRWFYYQMTPIDFSWVFLDTVEETITKLSKYSEDDYEPESYDGLGKFLSDWKEAKNLATNKGCWEGDFSESPRVFWIPAEQEFAYGFVWKQGNNGSTFVISPHPLPHLDEHTF